MTARARCAAPVPPSPESSTRQSFDARASDLLQRLTAQRDHLRAIGDRRRAADVEPLIGQVTGMRNAMRIQDGTFEVQRVAVGNTEVEQPARRTCVVCGEAGHNVATHGRRGR